MPDLLKVLALWLWRLIPANPILVRVVGAASRRPRDLMLRIGYLGILFLVVFLNSWQVSDTTLAGLAKAASTTFTMAAIAQLAMTCFLAPIFTAGAITQEKDAQTFNILLTTPLSNAQIVFGSLLSRLYFVVVLLIAGLPIFCITMIYGGVTGSQITLSFAISAATAVLTGSLAIAVSMLRVGTRKTIFSFFLVIFVYLLAVYSMGMRPWTWVEEAPTNVSGQKLSYFAAFHPFLALEVALNKVPAPTLAEVADYGRPMRYLLAYPHTSYVFITVSLALLVTVGSVFLVRRGPRENQASVFARLLAWMRGRRVGERKQAPRRVWNNPVAWREAATRASAVNKGVARVFLMGGGVVAGVVLLIFHLSGGGFVVGDTRDWLSLIILAEFCLVLILACNTAATAISKERESKTFDILLTTPLQPRDVVWGKLRGLVSFALPLLAVPTVTLLLFGVVDGLRRSADPVVAVESAFEAALLMVAYVALACMTSMRISLRSRQTVQAVMVSAGTLLLIYGLASAIVNFTFVLNFDEAAAFFGPFSPYTLVTTLVDAPGLFQPTSLYAASATQVRVNALLGSLVATAVLLAAVYANYTSMVKEFDMTIRKQSGT